MSRQVLKNFRESIIKTRRELRGKKAMRNRSKIIYDSSEFVENFRSLTSTIAEGVVITDEKENIIWVNKSFEKICGYTLEEMLGKKPKVLQGKDTDRNSIKAIREALSNKKTIDTEILNYRPDGTPYWVKITITPVVNEKNDITNFIAFEHDITEEKKKSLEIEESEKLYKNLFEKNPEIMFIFDPKTYKILEANETALKVYGYTKNEFLKLTIKDLRPKGDWNKVKKILPKVKDDFIMQGVWKHLKKSGEIIFVEVKASRTKYKGKEAILVIPTDVTEKIKSDEEIKQLNKDLHKLNNELTENLNESVKLHNDLKANNEKLNQIRNAAKIGIWELNLNTLEVKSSEEVWNIFEVNKDDKHNLNLFTDIVHKDDVEKFTQAVDYSIKNNTPLDIEYKIALKGGRHKHLVSKGAVVYDEKGNPEMISGITLDVTEKKHNEELIAEQLKNINIILGSITDPFYIIDKNYNLLYINDVSLKLSGFSREYLIGKSIWDVYPERDFKQEKKEYAKALKSNKTHHFETEYFGRTFSVTVYPSEIGLAISAKDITENIKVLNELKDKAKFIQEIGDNTQGGIIQTAYSRNGKVEVRYLSAGFEDLWGISIEDVKANPDRRFEVMHPEDRDNVKKEVLNSVKKLLPVNHKFRYVNKKTGEIKWVRANTVPTKLPDGTVLLNGVFLDITESQKYYEELEKSNERYNYVSLAAREGIWDLDFKTGIVHIGGNYADIMKASRAITSLPMTEFEKAIHPDDTEKVLKSFDAVLKNPEVNLWEETFRLLNLAGETVHVLERGYVIRDEKTKQPLRFVGSTFDITDRVKYEESLKEKAEFIKSISDNVPGAIFEEVFYPDGRLEILFMSDGFEKFTGISNDVMIKDPDKKMNVIHPDDIDMVLDVIRNLKDYDRLNNKLRYVNYKTGEVFYVNLNAVVRKNPDDSITLTGVIIDVSDTEKYYRELEKSNRRYEYVSKATNETIWEWDLKTNIIAVGGNYKEMFGEEFPENKINFDYVYSRIHPDDLDIVRKSIQYGLKDYENHFRETSYRMFRKDGSIIYVSDRSYTIFDPVSKEPLKIIGSTVDITEKKKYEASLKEQAQFIKHISDNIPGGIFESIYYPGGKSKLVYASEGFEELWGIPVDKVMENPEMRFLPIHEDDIEITHEEIKNSIENLIPLNIKFRFVNQKTGKVRWIRSKCLTSRNEDGSTILYGLMIDVTDTEKYYTELENSNKRFEYLSKASNEIIWEMDLKTMVTTFGGNYENILGCSFPEHKADLETRKSFVHPEDLKRVEEFIAIAMRDKVKSFWEISFRVVSKQRKIFYVYEKGYIIRDEKTGEPLRAIGSAMDITDKKKAEDESKEHAKFLKEISDSMDGFIFQTEYDNDFNAKLNYASEKAKDYWGITVDEAKKDYFKTAENVFYEDRSKLNELRLNAVKNLTILDHKFRYYNTKKGGLRWVRAVAVPSRLPDGRTIFNGIVTDVTETEKFYTELEKSNQRYEYVSKAANEAIWDLDLRTNMFTFGGSYKEMLGYYLENDSCHNNEVIQMTHPEDRERVHASIEEVMNDKEKNYWEDYYRMIKKDGGVVHVYDRGYVIRDERTFEPLRFVGVTQDITQQKLYEEALEEQVRKVNVIIESLTDPFFVISKDMEVIIANSAAHKLTKKSKQELIHKNIYDFVFVRNHAEIFDLFKESIEKNRRIHEEIKVGDKWYDILLYPSSIGLAVYSKDITEKKKRQQELQKNAKFISEISESTPGFLFQLEFDENLKPKLNYASEKAEEFWGITAKAAMEGGEELFSAVHEDDKIPFITSLKESVSKLHNLNIKYRLTNKLTNVTKWVRAAAIPSRLDNGQILLSGTVIDITEAEEYYNQLEQANERYENVSNAINNAIWELDIRTGTCVMGGAYEQMYGYKLKDNILTDEFHKKILHPDDYEEITKAKAEALSDKNNRRWERTYRIIRADGEVIYVNDRAYIVYDEKTQMPVKIIGSTQDITDKIKHNAEQERNQKFLKEISDSIDGFVFQLEFDKNKKPRLNYMSEKAEHFTGDNVKEALEGRTTVFSSIYEEDLPLFKDAITESISKLIPLNFKFRHVNKKTNEIFTVRASALPTLLENGNTMLNGVVIDITESENYYNKLEEITRRYEYISKASNETIWEMDVQTREVILGGGYREMFGTEFPGNKITYSQWQSFVHPDDLSRIEKSMHETIVKGNNKYWESNFRIINYNKKVIDIFERAFIVYDEKTNAPIKIIGSTQDITQINKMRAERENMIDDLVNRNKALEQFTYMVSHNLRAPIANILGISYLLEDNPDEKTQTEMHQLIKESSSKLDSVIRDMNEILSIKKGYDEEKTEVRFEDVLNEIKETEKELISKSGVQIVSDFTEAASIKSVKGYLYSIFHNLISNGIKYRNGAIPNIKITSKADDKFVYLSFEDNGIGIDLKKNAGKIFGLYSKFHLNKEGKGMGLFMVKNQVESLGGEIKVRSKVNEGTTFTIKFKK